MGKKSTKNNRSKRSKVSMPKKNRSRFTSVTFHNTTIQANWDNKKTVSQNMKDLGLSCDANEGTKQTFLTPKGKEDDKNNKKKEIPEAIKEMLNVSEEMELVRAPHFMTEDEQMYFKNLIDKHNDNYTAMFRDIKLNYKQHPISYLERRCKRYLAFMNLKKSSS